MQGKGKEKKKRSERAAVAFYELTEYMIWFFAMFAMDATLKSVV